MGAYTRRTQGTCAKAVTVELDGKTIKSVAFDGGCPGNTTAIAKIVRGMDMDHVVGLFKGHQCGARGTSCADQLALTLEEAYAKSA